MEECVVLLVVTVILILFCMRQIGVYKNAYKEVDGVRSLDGIQYLIKGVDIEYVIYKLNATLISEFVKERNYERTGETEGLLRFGGICYDIGRRNGDGNIGATFKITMFQKEEGVVLKLSFVENRGCYSKSSRKRMPEFVLQQAYHRFFKEQFDVTVVAKRMPVRQVLDDEYVWNIGMSIGMVGLLAVAWIAILCGWIWG